VVTFRKTRNDSKLLFLPRGLGPLVGGKAKTLCGGIIPFLSLGIPAPNGWFPIPFRGINRFLHKGGEFPLDRPPFKFPLWFHKAQLGKPGVLYLLVLNRDIWGNLPLAQGQHPGGFLKIRADFPHLGVVISLGVYLLQGNT